MIPNKIHAVIKYNELRKNNKCLNINLDTGMYNLMNKM